MMLPTLKELREQMHTVLKQEDLMHWRSFTPRKIIGIMYRYRFMHFLLTGAGGLAVGLTVMWMLTTFVLGVEGYFTAYLIGAAVTLTCNFTVYSLTVFRTFRSHAARFAVFVAYNIGMTGVQAFVIRSLTPVVGAQRYLLVVVGVVLLFSVVNYLVFKTSLFRERPFRAL